MGCNETKDARVPTLICFFEQGNEAQKEYCLKLRDNFKSEKTIKYEIKSAPNVPFTIRFKINDKTEIVQEVFDNSEEAMNTTLQKIYNILK